MNRTITSTWDIAQEIAPDIAYVQAKSAFPIKIKASYT